VRGHEFGTRHLVAGGTPGNQCGFAAIDI